VRIYKVSCHQILDEPAGANWASQVKSTIPNPMKIYGIRLT